MHIVVVSRYCNINAMCQYNQLNMKWDVTRLVQHLQPRSKSVSNLWIQRKLNSFVIIFTFFTPSNVLFPSPPWKTFVNVLLPVIWVPHTLCNISPHPRGGTQLWVGYGCAARSLDHHLITKPEKVQICNL